MMSKRSIWLALALIACAGPSTQETPPPPPPQQQAAQAAVPPPEPPKPPIAKKVPQVRKLHGDQFVDDYFWLREKGTPDVLSYLKDENDYTTAMMKPYDNLVEDLFHTIVSHVAQNDETQPAKFGEYVYWAKIERGKEYWTHLRKKVAGGEEKVILDVNELAAGKPYMALGELKLSDDNKWLAYSTDETGYRQYTLHFKNLDTGALSPETIERVVMATFAADNKTVFYVVEDDAKRPYRLYRHTVGGDPKQDELVLEEKDGRFEQYVWKTTSGAWIVADAESQLANEIRLIDAKKPASKPVLVRARKGQIKMYPEHRGDRLIIRINDTGRNFRLVAAPILAPGTKWKELRAHDPKVMIEDVAAFSDFMVMVVRDNGLPQLEVQNFKARTVSRLTMPEQDFSVSVPRTQNREYNTSKLRYAYESMSTPETIFELDLSNNQFAQLKQQPVPGYDPAGYATERIFAKAKDGTQIPISIVYKKGVAKDGTAPLHLIGYGSYGYPFESDFSPSRLALLDKGVIYAVAHIRGGGELGKVWHEEGRLAKKMNTFTDFIACAEHLIAEKYTSKEHLTIEGHSAGGLLMGAVLNLRPDLFKAAVVGVPFVDVINTMNDPSIPLTITEYEEWGNPKIAEQYKWLRAYSPYDNLAAKEYPSILVRTSINDSQVPYWEPAKFVARMRALKKDQNPLLLKVHLDEAGHGGKSGRYERYRDEAFDDAFILWQLGLAPEQPKLEQVLPSAPPPPPPEPPALPAE